VTKLYFTGSVLYEKISLNTHVLTEEKLDDVDTQLEASPKKLALQGVLAESTAHVGKKLRMLRPYRTTVARRIFPVDCKGRIRYYRWLQESAFSGLFTQNLPRRGVRFTAAT
jgi:hypothetical protein